MVADEDGAGVADAAGAHRGVGGDDFEVLGGPGIDDLEPVVQVVDQDVGGLAVEGRLHPLAVPGGFDLADQLGVDGVEQLGAGGHQQAGRQRVVLGLGDQVGGDVRRDRRVVGQDRDLGRSSLGVDAAAPLDQTLGGGDVDVARAGDDVHRSAPLDPVREHRDGLGAAHGPHLVDAEQGAGGQHDRVRQPVGLRGAGDREAADPGDLGGDDVHHHAARVGDATARHVEPDPADRHPALGHGRAVDDPDDLVGPQLSGGDGGRATHGLLEGAADGGVEPVQGLGQGLRRDPQGRRLDAVEAQGGLAHGLLPAVTDRLDDRADLLDSGRDVELGPREQRERVDVAAASQVDAGQHEGLQGRRGGWMRLPRPVHPGRSSRA